MAGYNPFRSKAVGEFYIETNLVLKRILPGRYTDRISLLYQEIMKQKFGKARNPSTKELLDVTEEFVSEYFGYSTGRAVRQAYASLKLPLIPQTSKQIFYPSVEIQQGLMPEARFSGKISKMRISDINA